MTPAEKQVILDYMQSGPWFTIDELQAYVNAYLNTNLTYDEIYNWLSYSATHQQNQICKEKWGKHAIWKIISTPLENDLTLV